jgi:hypothetical protein
MHNLRKGWANEGILLMPLLHPLVGNLALGLDTSSHVSILPRSHVKPCLRPRSACARWCLARANERGGGQGGDPHQETAW